MCDNVTGCPCYIERRRQWQVQWEDPMDLFRRIVAEPQREHALRPVVDRTRALSLYFDHGRLTAIQD